MNCSQALFNMLIQLHASLVVTNETSARINKIKIKQKLLQILISTHAPYPILSCPMVLRDISAEFFTCRMSPAHKIYRIASLPDNK